MTPLKEAVTALVQDNSQLKLGVSENPPFYQCARANARAKILSKALQTKGVWGYARPENLEI